MLGKVNGEKHASVTEWNTHFSPGPIINGQPAMIYNPSDSARYTIYKLIKVMIITIRIIITGQQT